MSRRRPVTGALLALMLSTGAALAACGGGNDVGERPDGTGAVTSEETTPSEEIDTNEPAPPGTEETESPAEAPPAEAPATTRSPSRAVVVERIIDGDTIEVRGDGDILPEASSLPVRLLEIDAPEKGACYSSEATARIEELIPVGSGIRIERDKDLKDPYDRYLLYVWNDQEEFVNESLVRDGYAKAVLYEPNDKYWQTISQTDDDAEQNGSGLWSACDTETDTPTPPATPEPTDPEPTDVNASSVVREYFAAVNARDYRRAWDLGGNNLSGSYAAFVDGFADTAHDTVHILRADGDTVSVRLEATQTDGSLRVFEGTYTVRGGRIVEADIREVAGPEPQPTEASPSYENCDEAEAAGAAPLDEGEPGYAPHLDRDGDGTACEPYAP